MTALLEAEVTTHPPARMVGILALPAVGAAPTITRPRQAGTGEEEEAAVTQITPLGTVGKEQEEEAAAVMEAVAAAVAAARAMHLLSLEGLVAAVETQA
jgi:hypothetical protein